MKNDKRTIFGWAMYDWANSAYSTVIAGAVLPAYFAGTVVPEGGWNGYSGEAMWSFVTAMAAALLFLLMPVLGAMADFSANKRRFLAVFAYGGAMFTVFLFAARPGAVVLTLVLFFFAQLGFVAANVFYDGFLPDISTPDTIDRVSARGYAIGYVGGGVYLAIALALILLNDRVGIDKELAARIGIGGTGLWWAGFTVFALTRLRDSGTPSRAPEDTSLPRSVIWLGLGLFVLSTVGLVLLSILAAPEEGADLNWPALLAVFFGLVVLIWGWVRLAKANNRRIAADPTGVALYRPRRELTRVATIGFRRTWTTAQRLRLFPQLLLFVLAFILFNDGVQTTINISAVYATGTLKLEPEQIAETFLVVQFVAFGGALLFGWLSGRIGIKPAIQLSLVIWVLVACAAYFLPEGEFMPFLATGVVIGLVLGGTQALSRSLYGSMIPEEASAEFYGFYSVFSKFSAIWGPLMFAFVRQLTGSGRNAILSLILFFVVGAILLSKVDVEAARASRDRWHFDETGVGPSGT